MEIKKEIDKHLEDFRFLSETDIKKLQEVSLVRSYKKGQVLFDPGDSRTHIFFLHSGVVRLERVDSSASFFYLHFINQKNLFPRTGLFYDSSYHVSAVAHTDIEIISIPIKVFEEVMSHNNQQLMLWIKSLSDDLKIQTVKIQKGAINNAYDRITTTLAIICHDLGTKVYPQKIVTIPCLMTINDIARARGTTRETASSVIKNLVKDKKINYNRKKLTFLNTKFFADILAD